MEKSLRAVIERLLRDRTPGATADLRARLAADFADALGASAPSPPVQSNDHLALMATHLDGRLNAPARDAFVQELVGDPQLRADLAAAAALLDAISDELDPVPAAFRAGALTTLTPPQLVGENRRWFAGWDRRKAVWASLGVIAAVMVLVPFVLPRGVEWPLPSDAIITRGKAPSHPALGQHEGADPGPLAMPSSSPSGPPASAEPKGADLQRPSSDWVASRAQDIGPVVTHPQAASDSGAIPCEDYRAEQEGRGGPMAAAKRAATKAARAKTDGRSNETSKSPCAQPQSGGGSGLANGAASYGKPHIK